MIYPTEAVANYFLERARAVGEEISPMKLQKLVYYAHGWHLGILGEPLIDEQIEAWQYGPVIRSLYHEFKEFGNQPINRLATIRTPTGASAPRLPESAVDVRAILDEVYDSYGVYTPFQLSMMTHAPGTPWNQTFERYQGTLPRGTDIPQNLIEEHFRHLALPSSATTD